MKWGPTTQFNIPVYDRANLFVLDDEAHSVASIHQIQSNDLNSLKKTLPNTPIQEDKKRDD